MANSVPDTAAPAGMTGHRLNELLAYADGCRSRGDLLQAEAACREVLKAAPDLAVAEHLLALIAYQRGQVREAIELMRRVVRLAPETALFQTNLGEMLRQSGQLKDAVTHNRRATVLDPANASAWSNLGAALYDIKDYDGSVKAHRRAVQIAPDFPLGHCNLGNALYGLKRLEDAIAAYRHAVELDPNLVDAWGNLGTALHHHGAYEEAIAASRRAMALSPEHANARSGLGMLLLMHGDFAEGWSEYEWRLKSSERKGPRFPENPWRGDSLAGRHIYVQAEQGFGDTLQFVRYIPLLARRAGKVSLRVHQQLAGLLRENLPGIDVLGDRGAPEPFDCDIALMSLPYYFNTRYETIPADVPYLRPPQSALARWRDRFDGMSGLKVGLIWGGNPEHVNDRRRSLDLKHLAPLLDIPGASFASLQFGPRAADLKTLGRGAKKVLDLSNELGDFANTAGAFDGLDLIISIDSSGAHLAGALGKPVWVLLSDVADWRWRLDREDNAWYPNARLFRQKAGEDWGAVVSRLSAALDQAIADPAQLMPFLTEGLRRSATAMAIIGVETARAATPQAATSSPAMTAGQLVILAEQKRRQRLLADAQDLCERAVTLEPANADAVHLLGVIAHESGRLADAIGFVRRAARLAPEVPLYHANLGEMCRLAGLVDEAIAEGRTSVGLQPENPSAWSNLGIALFDRGDFVEALGNLDRAVAIDDTFAMAHSNRGNALQRLKRFSEAEAAYRRSLELESNYAEAWNNLGTCLRELKRFDEAEGAYRQALALKPHDPDILDSLALALKDLERFDDAAAAFQAALAIEARNDKIYVHFAAMLIDRHQPDDCEQLVQRALALNPNSPDAFNLKGRVCFEREQPEQAVRYFQRALELKPDLADAYNNMGNALKELGKLDEALAAYTRALDLDPDVAGVYVNLADSMKFKPGDATLQRMEAMATRADGLSSTDRLQLDFALGKAYADLRDHERSFHHFLRGNAAKRAQIVYDEKQALALFDRIEATFSKKRIAEMSGRGDPSSRPIFVLGMPRSGTTLVEQIIASHPLAHGAGELATLHQSVDAAALGGRAYPEFMASLNAASLSGLGADYLDRVRKIAPIGERVTDKMPSNFYYVGLIHLALPNARIIHTIRNPIDNCVSCFSKLFSAEQNHTYDLGELGRYYQRYERLMTHWREVLPAGAFLDVHYEDVVADLEGAARRIIAHCELPWDERCLSFHTTDRPVRTASAIQVRQPIYKTAVGRWKVYEPFLEPLLRGLGRS